MFVCIQVVLGITTLLSATTIKAGVFGFYEYLATAHQTVALLFISSLVMQTTTEHYSALIGG